MIPWLMMRAVNATRDPACPFHWASVRSCCRLGVAAHVSAPIALATERPDFESNRGHEDGPHWAPESVFTFRVGPAFAFLTPGDTPATEATMRTTLVATICVITACAGSRSESDRANDTADTAGAQIAAGEVAPSSHNTATALSDATVLGQLAEANQAEIAVGQMALQRTKSSEVRSFARRMVSDHTKMLNAGKAVADSLAVTPSPPSPDSLPQKTDQETQTLSALTGTAFDKAYM